MTLLFDKDRPIKSPALAPAQDEFERAGGELTIGLVNNMPDSALKATERQFMRLVQAASGDIRVNFHCFSLPAVARSKQASEHIAQDYADIADLDRLGAGDDQPVDPQSVEIGEIRVMPVNPPSRGV